MTPTETTAVLRQLVDWRRDKSNWPPSPGLVEKAIDAAIEMIDRSVKLEQALQAMTKAYKSVPYAQWPAEMHFANEVLESSK